MKIHDNDKVYFVYYRNQYMHYAINIANEKWLFPVPIDEATLYAEGEAHDYMKHIKRAIHNETFVKIN